MARNRKQATDPTEPVLFNELKRRHPYLILPKLLAESAMKYPFEPLRLEQTTAVLAKWADLAAKGALKHKETSLDAEFLRVIFADALGYKSRTDSPDSYELERQFTVTGAGTADGALGRFGTDKDQNPLAIIECKGASTDLDHDKSNGRTAVQQLSDYLAQMPDTPWGILSNYVTIRLYHRDSPMRAYQEFTVADFRNPQKVQEFFYLFEPGGLLGPTRIGKARSSSLLEGSEIQQRTVGDKLYDYYSEQRIRLIDALIHEEKYSIPDAIHAAQRLLDRVIFVAFCQHRGLLPPKLLESTWANVAPLARATNPRWQNFLDMFHAIDKGHKLLDLPTGYNGGLFRKDDLIDDLQLEDEPWTTVFKNLGDYDFREEGEVNVDVLGHLFEKSVTELEKLRVVGLFGKQRGSNGTPEMPKSAMRKRFGIYYTPPPFTRFIVERTVGRLIEERVDDVEDVDRKLAGLRKIKVVDPACGSGAFLIAAYERFQDAYETIVHFHRVQGRMDDAARIEADYPDWILADNVYGMDLSSESVEITQLALWIRSARKGKTLADLSANIICGNSLVGDPAVHERAVDWRAVFPAVFANGGFDCVIGNPPWERMKLQEREFFALSSPEIASAVSAADRRRLIAQVEKDDPALWKRYTDAQASADKTLAYVRQSGRYPLTGRGDINTYVLFAELSRQLVAPDGLIGLLVPSGIATDDTTKHFFQDLMDNKALASLYDFENHDRIFADVDGRFKFSIVLMNGTARKTDATDFVFFARNLDDLNPKDRQIAISARDLKLVNPNTRTCPIFRFRRDAELTKRIYRHVPVLIDESRQSGGNPWGVKFLRMFDQTNDAESFHTAEGLKGNGYRLEGNRWIRRKEVYLPLYEAKMIQAFDHRAAGVEIKGANWLRQGQTVDTPPVHHENPEFVVMPRFWIAEAAVASFGECHGGFLAYKDITSPTNQRTMIAAMMPCVGVVNSAPLILPGEGITARRLSCLLGNLNSFAYDFVARQKVGGLHLNYFVVQQLPTFAPDLYDEKCPWDKKTTLEKWISERVLKLTCTAKDMCPFAEAAGFKPGIYKWKDADRAQLRAELDAAYFILYGSDRDEINYVLSQFQGVVKEDEASGGEGPTRRMILEAFDAMSGT